MVLNHILNYMRPKKLCFSPKKSNVSLFYSLIRYIYIYMKTTIVSYFNWSVQLSNVSWRLSPFLASESIQLSLLFLLNCKRCSCRHFFFVLSFFFFSDQPFFFRFALLFLVKQCLALKQKTDLREYFVVVCTFPWNKLLWIKFMFIVLPQWKQHKVINPLAR